MLSKRYESTEVDRRTWLHVPSVSGFCERANQIWGKINGMFAYEVEIEFFLRTCVLDCNSISV